MTIDKSKNKEIRSKNAEQLKGRGAFWQTLKITILIFLILALFEIVVEIRAIKRGYSGHWIESVSSTLNKKAVPTSKDVNKSQAHSLRNRPVLPGKTTDINTLRVLVMGSSESADERYSVEEIWPTIFQDKINESRNKALSNDSMSTAERESLSRKWPKIEVINGSKAGLTLYSSFDKMKTLVKQYKPDVVLVYQLNNTAVFLSKKLQSGAIDESSTSDSACAALRKADTGKTQTVSLMEMSGLGRAVAETLGKTSIYEQLKNTIGINMVALNPQKKNDFPPAGTTCFVEKLKQYHQFCKDNSITLVLSDFNSAVTKQSSPEDIRTYARPLFKYTSYLSEVGWVNSIQTINEAVKSYGDKLNIPVLSSAKEISGQSSLFTDFVHFTKAGHVKNGTLLAHSFYDTYLAPSRKLPRRDSK